MQEKNIYISHSRPHAKCFTAKLRQLTNRFLHLQLYVQHHLMEEASGANTWMQNQHNFWYGASLDKGITKSPKYSQELFFSKKSEDFENH